MVNISWKPLLLDDVCWGLSGFNMFQWRNAIWSVVFPVSSLARQISSCGNGGALENIVMGPIVYCHLRSLRATERSPVASIDWGFLKWEYHGVPKTIRCQYSNGLTLDDLGDRFRNPPDLSWLWHILIRVESWKVAETTDHLLEVAIWTGSEDEVSWKYFRRSRTLVRTNYVLFMGRKALQHVGAQV